MFCRLSAADPKHALTNKYRISGFGNYPLLMLPEVVSRRIHKNGIRTDDNGFAGKSHRRVTRIHFQRTVIKTYCKYG